MPFKTTDENGNEIEALTVEEAEAKAQEAAQAAKAEAETKVSQLTEEVEKLKQNGANAGELRAKTEELEKAKTEAETKASAAEAKATEAITKVDAMAAAQVTETKDALINSLAGNDAELKKKIEFNFKERTAGPTTTKAEIEARVRDAYVLATGHQPTGVLVGATVSGAGGSAPVSGDWTPEETELATKFGITPDKLKKHPKKA